MPKFCAAWIFGMAHTISRAPHHHQCLLYCSSFPICYTPIHMFMLFCTCVAALHRHPKVNFIHYTAFKWFHLDTNKSLWIFFSKFVPVNKPQVYESPHRDVCAFLFLLQTEDHNANFIGKVRTYLGSEEIPTGSHNNGLFEGSPLVLSYRLEMLVNHLVKNMYIAAFPHTRAPVISEVLQ